MAKAARKSTSRRALVAGLAVLPALATISTAATPMSEIDRIVAGYGLDLTAIRARVELVADALDLPALEVEQAMSDPEDQSLIEFAHQYGQSIAWLLVGDLQGIVRERWRRHGADPNIRLPA